MPKSPTLGKWSGAVSVSVALVLLIIVAPIPPDLRAMVAAMLVVGWSTGGMAWLVQRYGRPAKIGIFAIFVCIGGWVGYEYWKDAPNRLAYSRIKELKARFVVTNGKIFTGDVEYVCFDAAASDEQVRQFTELEGLDKLRHLVFNGTKIRDVTAKKIRAIQEPYDSRTAGHARQRENVRRVVYGDARLSN